MIKYKDFIVLKPKKRFIEDILKNLTKIIILFLFLNNLNAYDLTKEEKRYVDNKKVILVSNETSYEPYDYNVDGKPIGYSIDLLELLLKNTGLKIKYITKPWYELLEDLENKKLDLVHTIYKTPDREKIYNYSLGYSKVIHSYIIRKNLKDIDNISELYGKKVGISKGWAEEIFFNQFPKIKKVYFETLKDKLDALSIGEIDAIANDENVASYYIKKYGYTNLKISNPIKNRFNQKIDDHHYVTLKDNQYLISIINKAYRSLSIEDIERLNVKWFGNINKNFSENTNDLTKEEKYYLYNKKVLKMCVLPDWLPFEQIDEKGNHNGIGADLINFVSGYINTPIVLVPTKQWSSSLNNIRERKCDILPVAMDVPSRRDAMDFTKPYWKEPFVIATKLDKFFIKDSKSIGNKKIGIVKSYAFVEVLKLRNPGIEIVEVKNAQEGLKKVQNDELFGYVDIMAAVGYNIQKYGFYDIKIAGKLEFTIDLSIASRNDEPILNSIMQKAVNNISDEKLRTIVGKWIEIKVEQSLDYRKLFYVIFVFTLIVLVIMYKNRSIKVINQKLTKAYDEINEQKQLSDSLTKYQQTLLSLFDKSDAVIFKWRYNENWDVEYVSLSISKLLGYDSNEFLSKKISYMSCIDKKDLNIVKSELEKNLKKGIDYFKHEPYRIITKSGELKWVLDYIVTIKDNEGEITHILGYVTDITDYIMQQDVVLQQSKMASLGEMIGNISHQWRQPLSMISTVSTGIKLKKELGTLEEDELINDMDMINTNAQYLSKTIDDFKNFIKGERTLIEFDICETIKQVLTIVKASITNNFIDVELNCESEVLVKGYPNEFIQSIINIYNNAKDALISMPEDERYFYISLKKSNDNIEIILKDNGGGIDEKIIDKIFEPYTTTKHKSMGTGLGLNITYNFIVTGMNGNISVENIIFNKNNKSYKGAKFKIVLPIKSKENV